MERITSEEDRTLKLVFCDEVGEMVVKLTGLHVLNLAIPKGLLSCPLFDMLFPLDPYALNLRESQCWKRFKYRDFRKFTGGGLYRFERRKRYPHVLGRSTKNKMFCVCCFFAYVVLACFLISLD